MQATKQDSRIRWAVCALVLAAVCLFAGACSSGPKVINLGGSGSRVTVDAD